MNHVDRKLQLFVSGLAVVLMLVPLGAQNPTITVTPTNPTILVNETQQFTQSGILAVTAIATGGLHTCLHLSDGSVRCMGRNNQGQLGNGTFDSASDPVPVSGLGSVASVKTGMEHSCALMADGTMQCWGTNYTGQLGIGGATGEHGGVNFSLLPVRVQGIANAIAALPGGFHTCAMLADRTVQCWGRNQDGQVGNGDRTTDTSVPAGPVVGLGSIAALAAGGYHNCALMPDNTVRCWGRNDDGQLGNGLRTSSATPVQVSGLHAAAVAAGGYHACALLQDGTVQCWGKNEFGQVGQPSSTGAFLVPTTVTGIGNAVAIVAGFFHTCAVLADGTTRCWGRNDYGQAGDGTISSSAPPTQVIGISGPSALAGGETHTCAIASDQSVQCWGRGDFGQLGNGGTTSSPLPVGVTGTGLTWTSSAPMVASIDAAGLARGLSRGISNITVNGRSGGSATTTLTVKEMFTLSVMAQGNGLGTVTSNPSGITCGVTCVASYLSDSQVTLTAAADQGSTFGGWSGCDTVSGTTCTVIMSQAKSVVATFGRTQANFTLTVSKADVGQGTVTSSPAGINCGTDCSESHVSGTNVTLTAAAASGSAFSGWSGCDTSAGATCTVSMNAARTVTATFKRLFILTVNKADLGAGTVSANPAGITCGTDCSEPYISGTSVTLTAAAASGSAFTGWSGCDAVAGAACTVTMGAARTVTATFKPVFTLTVNKAGLGKGTITSSPSGINCGPDCSEPYISGTTVTLTATPAFGSVFLKGWSGCNAVSGLFGQFCTVTMGSAKSVTANFVVGLP